MKHRSRLAAAFAGVALLAAAGACEDDEAACEVDTDCPQGTICRDQRCGPVGGEAGAPATDAALPPSCASEGAACAAPEECCSRTCTAGLCASAIPTAPCRGSLELCQEDCCAGLACVAGVCR